MHCPQLEGGAKVLNQSADWKLGRGEKKGKEDPLPGGGTHLVSTGNQNPWFPFVSVMAVYLGFFSLSVITRGPVKAPSNKILSLSPLGPQTEP